MAKSKLNIFLIGLFLTLSSAQLWGQKSFGREPKVFLKELEAFMTDNRNESGEKTFLAFKAKVEAKAIPEDVQLQRIIITCNEMLSKRMKASPDFENFLNTAIAFVDNGKMESHYLEWDKLLKTYYKGSSRNFSKFLTASILFVRDKKITDSRARDWYALSNDYTFTTTNGIPSVSFAKTDIKCVAANDSNTIYETSGTYFLEDYKWHGKGGKVTWERAGVSAATCFAKLGTYGIDLDKGEFRADSVEFFNSEYLTSKTYGLLEEKIISGVSTTENATYPRFTSYRKDLIITKFVDAVRYVGGYAQHGSKILAHGTADNPATFRYYYKNRLVLKVEGEELFVFKNEKVVTNDAAITIYLDSGTTILHPKVNFSYIVSEKQVTITRGEDPFYRAPFIDDYHNLEIDADIISWKVDEPKIDFKMIIKTEPATFSSYNFFKEYRYERLQGILNYNPLQQIKQYCDQNRVKEFYLKDYAKFSRTTESNLVPQFILLHDGGYLKFNSKTHFVQLYEKTFNYVNSHYKRSDYDVISFQSIIAGLPNASIDLEAFNMRIEGVPQIKFSDSQTVFAVPAQQRFTLKKNREMEFEGKVRAGRFEFFGKGFNFNYRKFTVDMNNVDSMRFFFPDEDNRLVKINSVLQDISGTLFIDQQFNKSGLKEYSEYPIFKSNKGSKVYYDHPTTFGGVYNRDQFYFAVDPFTIDSLDNFTRSGIRFPGTFHSAAIFPIMDETLILMDDYSLGFIKTFTSTMYKGVATSDMTVNLSNRGLLGDGEIKFAGSVSKSKKFMMFPDSTNGLTENFEVTASSLNPGAKGKNLYMHWEPYSDKMSQFTREDPIELYDDARFFGEYILGQKGSKANGEMNFNDAVLGSRNMSLERKKFTADTSTLVIKSIDTGKYAFRAVGVSADVDMEKRLGDFKALGEGANSEFPYNSYKGSLNEFKWDIKKKTLRFLAPPGTPEEKQYFVSTNAAQDSLKFISKNALYDLNTFVLYANEVPYINIADAKAMPDSGKVVIRRYGAMDTLYRAKLLVDTLNKYHTLYDCKLYVVGKYEYYGNGYYDYIDRSDKKNTILFNDVRSEKLTKRTRGKGYVNVAHDFTLSPKITYRGDVFISGANRGLEFDGFVMADTKLEQPLSWWTRHTQIIAPDSVFLWMNEPLNEDKKDLFTGFCIANDTSMMYANILSRKRNYSDGELLNVNKGVFYFDDATGEYIFGDSAKIYEKNPKGNYFSYNVDVKEMYGEGKLNFDIETNKLALDVAGNVKYYMDDSAFELKTAMLLDFPMPKAAKTYFEEHFKNNSASAPSNTENLPYINKALAELLNDKDYKKVKESVEKTNYIEVIKSLEKSMFITDASFTWNGPARSFLCEGPIGISNFGKEKIGKKIEGKIQVKRKRSGDELFIYLVSGSGEWFYFNYTRNKMNIFSSDNEFMRLYKEGFDEVKEKGYRLGIATEQGRKRFLRNFAD
jgi:hypothetical protein